MAKATPPAHEMPFLDHLEELRWRIVWMLAAVMVGLIVAFALLSKIDIIGVLERPVLPFLHGRKLVFTHPGRPVRDRAERVAGARPAPRLAGDHLPGVGVPLAGALHAREEGHRAGAPRRGAAVRGRRGAGLLRGAAVHARVPAQLPERVSSR
jgi:hypothetical protein